MVKPSSRRKLFVYAGHQYTEDRLPKEARDSAETLDAYFKKNRNKRRKSTPQKDLPLTERGYEDLKAIAAELGVEHPGNISKANLVVLIENFEADEADETDETGETGDS